MNIKNYHQISCFLNSYLNKTKENEGIFFISWLHLLRIHKSETGNKYELKVNTLEKIFPYKFILLVVKSFYNSIFYKKINLKNILKCENIYISHLITIPEKKKFKDLYFPNELKNKNSITLLINHTQNSEKKINKLLQEGYYLLSRDTTFASNLFFLRQSLKSYFKIRQQVKDEKSSLGKIILSKSVNEALSSNTISNHKIKEKCKDIFKILKPKRVFFTIEGHVYERAIISAAREISPLIKCIGYQHSSFVYTHNAMFQSYSKRYDPDIVLTTGLLASEYAKKKFKNKDIKFKVVGTNKRFENLITTKKTCLIAPEGYFSEVKVLCDFARKIAIKRPDIMFILRLHPSLEGNTHLKKVLNFSVMPTNIIISKNTILEDLRNSKIILYRGSTVSIQAGCLGITPVYLRLKNELTIDPLFNVGKNKLKISTAKQFLDVYDNIVTIPSFKSYCNNYYSPLNFSKKTMNDL